MVNLLPSSIISTFVGILPGAETTIATFLSFITPFILRWRTIRQAEKLAVEATENEEEKCSFLTVMF